MIFDSLRRFADTERNAAFDGEKFISFRELWDRSEAVARYLIKNNEKHTPVAIFGDKENDMLVFMIGTLKAGMTYVVTPSFYPLKKTTAILGDINAKYILNADHTGKDVSVFGLKTLSSSDVDGLCKNTEPVPEKYYSSGDDIACIIYTSGSTGTPKGVMLSFDNLVAKIAHSQEFLDPFLPENGRMLNFYSYAFSASLGSVYYAMAIRGATLYCVNRDIVTDAKKLSAVAESVQPHLILSTPSVISNLIATETFDGEHIKSLKQITFGGEPLAVNIARLVSAHFPETAVYNYYGTTESAGTPFYCRVTSELLSTTDKFYPFGMTSYKNGYLIDENGNIVTEENVTGEVVLNCDTVSRGYYKLPELTSKNFFYDTFGRWAYRTHDLAVIKNGYYYFVGRRDNQVKIGGNRIELEDVEANLRACEIVTDCAATVKRGETDSLVAFVIPSDPAFKGMKGFSAIKSFMRSRVEPAYIPQKIIFIDSLPKNLNGKLDRQALADLAQNS